MYNEMGIVIHTVDSKFKSSLKYKYVNDPMKIIIESRTYTSTNSLKVVDTSFIWNKNPIILVSHFASAAL